MEALVDHGAMEGKEQGQKELPTPPVQPPMLRDAERCRVVVMRAFGEISVAALALGGLAWGFRQQNFLQPPSPDLAAAQILSLPVVGLAAIFAPRYLLNRTFTPPPKK